MVAAVRALTGRDPAALAGLGSDAGRRMSWREPPPIALEFGLSSIELAATVEALTHERLYALERGGDATWLLLTDRRLAGPLRELERRLARNAAGRGPHPQPDWVARATAVAAQIRRRVDSQVPLFQAGWQPTVQRANGQLNGPCPFCRAGHDRFVVFPATPDRDGRVWCRRCWYSQDVIGLARDLRGVSFTTALYDLAMVCPGIDLVGLNLSPAELRQTRDNARRARQLPGPDRDRDRDHEKGSA